MTTHSPVRAPTPPTASLLSRHVHDPAHRRRVASLGLAVHHFVDFLDHVPFITAHRAASTLTTQIDTMLAGGASIEDIARIVVDPRRAALPDGTSAVSLVQERWSSIRPRLAERADQAVQGAEDFGDEAIVSLALVRGLAERRPWWGTAAWDESVDSWAATSPLSERLRHQLQQFPDRVADDIVADVLCYVGAPSVA